MRAASEECTVASEGWLNLQGFDACNPRVYFFHVRPVTYGYAPRLSRLRPAILLVSTFPALPTDPLIAVIYTWLLNGLKTGAGDVARYVGAQSASDDDMGRYLRACDTRR